MDNKHLKNKSDSTMWRMKLSDLIDTAQTELKKTTKIGLKMISASQSSVELEEIYETLGKWLVSEVRAGNMKIENADIEALISKVGDLEKELEGLEREVQDIKKS